MWLTQRPGARVWSANAITAKSTRTQDKLSGKLRRLNETADLITQIDRMAFNIIGGSGKVSAVKEEKVKIKVSKDQRMLT